MSSSSPSLGRLLISHITLRGPELAQFYAAVSRQSGVGYEPLMQQMVLHTSLTDTFELEESLAREALNFLLVARLIAQSGVVRRRSVFQSTPKLLDVPFELLLLHHLTTHEDHRQQAMSMIHRQLVLDDVLSIDTVDLRSYVERGSLRDLFAWTSEKLSLWTNLYSFLGTVRRLERSSEILLIPQPALLLAALRWVDRLLTDTCSLGAYLQAIDSHLFACITRRGRVHQGASQTLLLLQQRGELQLSHEADAARSILVGDRRVSKVVLTDRGGV